MEPDIKLGLYEHYKGMQYQVLGVCRHSETLEKMVIYQAFYGDYGYWVRPLEMFKGTIINEGKEVPRFKFIRPIHEVASSLR